MQRTGTIFLIFLAFGFAAILPPAEINGEKSAVRDTGIRLLGATRGYVSTGLWLRAGEAYRRGDHFETLATYQLIRELQPRNPAVYSYLGWNQAYNISPQFPSRDRQFEWVKRGISTLHEGQSELPKDASLLMDEWNFVLFKSSSFPYRLLNFLAPRQNDEIWALVVEDLQKRRNELSSEEDSKLEEFLSETGAQLLLFDQINLFNSLSKNEQAQVLDPDFEASANLEALFSTELHWQLASFLSLDEQAQGLLFLAHWSRLHLMALILEPASKIYPRSMTVDISLMNSYSLASRSCPPELADYFQNSYRMAVERAYKHGIDNARKHGGDELVAEFKDHMRENFEDQPGLLPE